MLGAAARRSAAALLVCAGSSVLLAGWCLRAEGGVGGPHLIFKFDRQSPGGCDDQQLRAPKGYVITTLVRFSNFQAIMIGLKVPARNFTGRRHNPKL